MTPIEPGEIFFTAGSGEDVELPRPFVVGARTVLLCECRTPLVAILGYGLGAVAHEMLRLRAGSRIFGVEVDAEFARRARREAPSSVVVRHGDALEYLRRTRRSFDLVYDDVFVLEAGEEGSEDARRPDEYRAHARLVARRLRSGGIYVRNLLVESRSEIEPQIQDMRAVFEWVGIRSFREWDNVFAIAAARASDLRVLR